MRFHLRAVDGAFVLENDALVAGLRGSDATGAEHYLTLQRSIEDEAPDEDWGIYAEFDDQINSGYGCVRRAQLSRTLLSLDLSVPLGALDDVDGFDVELSGDDAWFEHFRGGLVRIFRGMPNALELT